MKMAHNIMRVNSMNDRSVTETMIDLNLNLNEEIDFDFFDNVDTPTKESVTKNNDHLHNLPSMSCSPQPLEDDDDVQINPYPLSHNLRVSKVLSTTGAVQDINSSSDSIEEPLSTGTENDEKYVDNFDEYETSKLFEDTNTKRSDQVPVTEVFKSCPSTIDIEENSEKIFLQNEKSSCEDSLCNEPCRSQVLSNKLYKSDDDPLGSQFYEDGKEDTSSRESSLHQVSTKSSEKLSEDSVHESSLKQEERACIKFNENRNKDIFSKSSWSYDEGTSVNSSKNHNDDASSKSSESQKAEGSGSGYDSDEGCPFEGSDSDELLVGVHTLTIIPRENDEEPHPNKPTICEQTGTTKESEMIHSTSCEKAAITARSSSGYSSASCKAHGCMVFRSNGSKVDSRQSSRMKVQTPDMDEFIKSFRKIQSSPQVSFASADKYSSLKKRPRKNMSFSNEEMQRIERENAILLNKIVLQQRTRPTVVHKYERRVTSNAINRARQSKKIEYDNEILLRKIQDVKRKSALSTQNSRCISQASTSHI